MKRYILLGIIFVSFSFLLSCGDGGSTGSTSFNTGGITAQAEWPNSAKPGTRSAQTAPAGVVTVRMIVSGPDMTDMQQDFLASAGSGYITGVPVGYNRTLTLQGLDTGSAIIYQGAATNITVLTGQTTNAGTIVMISIAGDVTAPTTPTSLIATVASDTQINLTWTASTDDTGVAGYKVYRDSAWIANTASVSYYNTGLSPNTSYCYEVSAYDAAGNESTRSTQSCASTDPAPDVTAPTTPTGLIATVASDTQINLTWTASTDDTAVAGYKVYRDSAWIANTVSVSYSNTGLSPNTSYCYEVSAYDASGNESTMSTQSCASTDPAPDVTAPTTPTGLIATVASDTQINLTWTASTDDTGVAGYKVYRDSAWIANTVSVSYSNTGLSPNTSYCYEVSAYDASGNESTRSTQACTTTMSDLWTIDTVDSNGSWMGRMNSIAIDSLNNIHISYADFDNGYLKYATGYPDAWAITDVDTNAGSSSLGTSVWSSVAVDSGGNVHIAYRDDLLDNLNYATNMSGAWTTTALDTNSNTGLAAHIAIDSNDKAHITYSENWAANFLYITNASGAWDITNLGVYTYPARSSIVINSAGYAEVAHYSYNTGNLELISNSSGAWNTQQIDGMDGTNTGVNLDMARDSTDHLHIAYLDTTNWDLKYATNASGTWQTQVIDSSGDVGGFPRIAVDSSDKIHIVYLDMTNSTVNYATDIEGTWTTSAIAPSGIVWTGTWDSNSASDADIAIAPDGKIHVTYFDYTEGALKHAIRGAVTLLGKIAFETDRDGNNEIYIINSDGTGEANLTNNAAYDRWPAISPDGQSIAFASNRDGNYDVYRMSIDGSNVVQLTTSLPYDFDYISGIDWTVDGSKILFSMRTSNVFKIYEISASDGSGLTALTDASLDSGYPHVSKDGTKLYMTRNTPFNGYTTEIYSSNIDGTSMTQLTSSASGSSDLGRNGFMDEYMEGVTPKVVFARSVNSSSLWQLHTMDTDGSNVVNISNNSFKEPWLSSAKAGEVVFSSTRGDGVTSNIWRMNTDGTGAVQLTTQGGRIPDWWEPSVAATDWTDHFDDSNYANTWDVFRQDAGTVTSESGTELYLYAPKPASNCAATSLITNTTYSGTNLTFEGRFKSLRQGATYIDMYRDDNNRILFEIDSGDYPYLGVIYMDNGTSSGNLPIESSSPYFGSYNTYKIVKTGDSYSVYANDVLKGTYTIYGLGDTGLRFRIQAQSCAWKTDANESYFDYVTVTSP